MVEVDVEAGGDVSAGENGEVLCVVPSVGAVPLSSILGTGKGEVTYSTLLNSDFPLNLTLDQIPCWVLVLTLLLLTCL